ncbi:MAG: 4Fe-4S dicluster domain-containing protein [Vicinamibacteraceae bacterium]|nr:4Fe-4S dicluster domain-containing protein [Vicinamibacteraceae bacterium]
MPGPGAIAPRPAALAAALLAQADLERLIQLLARDHRVIAPVVRDGAVVCDEIRTAGEIAFGAVTEQAPARYRMTMPGDHAARWPTGPPATPWKRVLHPSELTIWRAVRRDGRLVFEPIDSGPPRRLALVGVRPCDLAAIGRLDAPLRDGPWPDAAYAARRRGMFVLAVQCTEPCGTCFCASMGTGPDAGPGADLVLTELDGAGPARSLLEARTTAGAAMVVALGAAEAPEDAADEAHLAVDRARARMGRALDTSQLPARLLAHFEHPRWETVAKKCLTCGNCTFACPTCFCTTVEDRLDLAGETAARLRRWDTCFSVDFSYMHGGSVRLSPRSRYRQWLTHKLATWHEQFGTSGCVGCGRCITWCPVGIDITLEAAAVADTAPRTGPTRRTGAHP